MRLKLLIDLYRKTMSVLLVGMIATLLAVMISQITLRYFFNSSLIWAEEVCRYLLIWASFLAAATAYERGEIPAFTMLRESLPARWGVLLSILCNLLGAALCAVLAYYGTRFAQMVGSQPIPALRFLFQDSFNWSISTVPSVFWVYFALPLGMALLGLRLLIDVGLYLAILRRGGNATELRGSAQGDIL